MQARKNTHRNTATIKLDQYENNGRIRGRLLILIFFKTSLSSRCKLLLMSVFTWLTEDASELGSWDSCTAALSAASGRKPMRRPPPAFNTAPTADGAAQAPEGRAGRSPGRRDGPQRLREREWGQAAPPKIRPPPGTGRELEGALGREGWRAARAA